MPDLPVQRGIDERIRAALGIVSPGNYHARLSETVLQVAQIPLGGGAEAALGFNDAETDGNTAFLGITGPAAVAAQFGHSQLLNPVGSGKVFYLDELVAWDIGAAANFRVAAYDTGLATLVGGLLSTRLGEPGSATEMRHTTNVAELGTIIDALSATAANVQVQVRFDPPLRLDPGKGVLVNNQTVNRFLSTSWKGREYIAT